MRPAPVGFQCPDDVRMGQVAQRTAVGAQLTDNASIVTSGLVLANVVAYVASVRGASGGLDNPSTSAFFRNWEEFPPWIAYDHEFYRLVTSAFLHVSLLHVTMNMIALWFVGPPLERLLGRWRFLALYSLGAFGGSIGEYVFGNPLQSTVGASGAIFGLFAGLLLFARDMRIQLSPVIGIVVINFVLTFVISDISRLGHLGGFVAGGLASIAIGGGVPGHRVRLSSAYQVAGLAAIAVLMFVMVAARTANFPSLTG